MASASQLTFDMALPPSFAAEDYVAGEANSEARAVMAGLAWPTPVAVLIGEAGSGKTHLAQMFARASGPVHWFDGALPNDLADRNAVVIDGLEQWLGTGQGPREDDLFHMLEAARAVRRPVLVTCRQPPENLGLKRPDTLSRLRAGARATIAQPDDALFLAIAVKQFTDRQLMVDPSVADYLLQRMERSYANLSKLIALIDERSLAAGRSVTKPLAREVLAAYELSQN